MIKNPKNRADYFREYRKKNRAKIQEYRRKNAKKIAEGVARWNKANPDRKRQINARYANTPKGIATIKRCIIKRRLAIGSSRGLAARIAKKTFLGDSIDQICIDLNVPQSVVLKVQERHT